LSPVSVYTDRLYLRSGELDYRSVRRLHAAPSASSQAQTLREVLPAHDAANE
jgi:hypothetical protein